MHRLFHIVFLFTKILLELTKEYMRKVSSSGAGRRRRGRNSAGRAPEARQRGLVSHSCTVAAKCASPTTEPPPDLTRQGSRIELRLGGPCSSTWHRACDMASGHSWAPDTLPANSPPCTGPQPSRQGRQVPHAAWSVTFCLSLSPRACLIGVDSVLFPLQGLLHGEQSMVLVEEY